MISAYVAIAAVTSLTLYIIAQRLKCRSVAWPITLGALWPVLLLTLAVATTLFFGFWMYDKLTRTS